MVGAPPRVLFVTRKFPPSVGGMETLAASVWESLSRQPVDATLVALRGRQWWLPLFIPYAWARTTAALLRDRRTTILLGDALLQSLMWPLFRLFGVSHTTMVMGLDLTWPFPPYQWWLRRSLPKSRRLIAISRATAAVAPSLGVRPEDVAVLRLAVPVPDVTPGTRASARRAIRERYRIGEDSLLLVSVSRLVRRKGMRWFVDTVLPQVPQATLLIAGDGPERDAITAAVAAHGLGGRCRLLGAVDAATREELMLGADVFVQPNIRVPEDMEGFGLVAIEAASRGALVVAAALEGLQDAVIDGVTGLLRPPEQPGPWIETLSGLATDADARAQLAARLMEGCRREFDLGTMGRSLVGLLPS